MSYIFIDVDESRRCVKEITAATEAFRALINKEQNALTPKLQAYCDKVLAMAENLSDVTEAYAAEDEKLKWMHLNDNEGGRLKNGQ